jgi:hypothetical protein
MEHLKRFNETYSYTTESEIDEAMQWFVDQYDTEKIYNIRKTICAFKTRDKSKLTPEIAKEFIRLTQKINCDITLSMGYKIGDDDGYFRLEEKLHTLAKPLLDFVTKHDVNSHEIVVSFVFSASDDILDPYYLSYSLELDVLRFDKVPFSIIEKLIKSKEAELTEKVANSIFTTCELMIDLAKYKNRIVFNGLRVIDRPDARVQLEGFYIKELTDSEMDELQTMYGNADTFELNRDKKTLYTWWD